ncbi:response regulator [Nocardioides pacificus]
MTRVLIVDDDPLVRSALTLMLGGRDDLDLVGEAGDGRAALAAADRLSPDVVLMDVRMPVLNGIEATRALCAGPTPPKVIVLTTFDADEYVVEAVAAGADGFLLKDTPPAQIVAAITRVAQGEPILSASATRTLITRVRSEPGPDEADAVATGAAQRASSRVAVLTDREREVAIAVGRGLSNAEIAKELYLSIPTVKAHVSRIFDKLQVTNRVQVAMCVHVAGLV